MPVMDGLMGRLTANVRARIDSVTKTLPEDFRSKGAVAAAISLGERFGHNNRDLIH